MILKSCLIILLFCLSLVLFAQERESPKDTLEDISLDSIDDLFSVGAGDSDSNEELSEDEEKQNTGEPVETDVTGLLKELTAQTGFSLKVNYAFAAGFAPGWSEVPWNWEDEDEEFTKVIGADLTSDFIFDFQLTPQLRAYQSFSCDFPNYEFALDSFWAEYNLENKAFFKLGHFAESWGLGGNYNFANLLARLPEDGSGGDAYTFRMNLPVGVGGIQLLTMARSGWVEDGNIESLEAGNLGYGVKYNYAHPLADINMGVFYHDLMPLRAIATTKTTLLNSTELFLQGLAAFPDGQDTGDSVYSGSIALADDFFNDKLTINLEYFYNGEVYTGVVETDSGWTEEEVSPFIKGHNAAFNLYYNTGIRNLNFFSRFLYNFDENTGKWAPGFRLNPYDDLSVYLSVPVVLGDRSGTYYRSNYDEKNRPFSITLAVTLSGSQKFAQYR